MNIRFYPIVALGVFLALTTFKVSALTPEIQSISNKLLDMGAGGFSVAIINKDGSVWSDGYGYADVKQKLPMTSNTVLNIASISKALTGAAIMHLVEKGKLDLDKDINNYIPFKINHPKYPKTPITVRQLLTHTASIKDREKIYTADISYNFGGDNPISLSQFIVEYFIIKGEYYDASNFSAHAPGTQFEYSNIAYGLAGYIVEIISGMPLDEYTQKNFFAPLKMTSTAWKLEDIDQNNHAKLYRLKNSKLKELDWYGLATWPDGGLRTSVSDFSRFFAAMMNEGKYKDLQILSSQSVKEMLTPQFTENSQLSSVKNEADEKQLITWTSDTSDNGDTYIGHSGGDPGVSTHAYFNKKTKTGAIIFMNTDSASSDYNETVGDLLLALLEHSKILFKQ